MSEVDTRFSKEERDALLQEIRADLPAFISGATLEREDAVGDVSRLLNLEKRDLERVIAVHLALSESLRVFVRALPGGLRRPITSSVRPKTLTQEVRGAIDWGATMKYRAGAGYLGGEYVVRPARRVFDTPENRALVYLLERIDELLKSVLPASLDTKGGVYSKRWLNELRAMRASVTAARIHPWLREVPAGRPIGRDLIRLSRARTDFYRTHLFGALSTLQRYTESPDQADITDLLAKRYFEPERDWKLFELVVALRLALAFEEKSVGQRRSRLLHGAGNQYGRYKMPDGAEVSLWYQSWPSGAGSSLHREARTRYQIASNSSRPDIMVQRSVSGKATDTVLLELKASRSSQYLGQGLMQLLGYMKDRPQLLQQQPAGWLVAPASGAFLSKDPEGLDLWVVSGEEVAQALMERFGY